MRRCPAVPRTSMLTRAERGYAWQARRQPSARSFSGMRLSSRSVGAVSSPEPSRTRHFPHVPRPAQSVGISIAARTRPSNRLSCSSRARVSPMGSTKTLGTLCPASGLGRPEDVGHAVLAVYDLLHARGPHVLERGLGGVEELGDAEPTLQDV